MSSGGAMGIGGSLSESDTKQKTKNYPKWAKDYLQQYPAVGSTILNRFNPQGGAMQDQATSVLSRTLAGDYEDPSKNPALAGVISGLERSSGRLLDRANQAISGNASRAGMLYSTAAGKQRGATAEAVNADLMDKVGQLLYGNQQAERSRTLGAVSPALNLEALPLTQSLAIAEYLKGLEGQSSSSTSGWTFGGQQQAKT